MNIDTDAYRVDPKKKCRLKDFSTRYEGPLTKESAAQEFLQLQQRLQELQEVLYADGSKALLVVLQAMDAAGKDSTIRNVFGPLNPQGCRVASFKAPNPVERMHDFLWRIHQNTPRKGYIGVFNRSHYEDVLIVRVKKLAPDSTLKSRYAHINNFEEMLHDEGTRVVKFFLNISRDYQKEQLQERLDTPEKRWKFSASDLPERALWDDYQEAYDVMLGKCSTKHAPWYVIPAERKWFRNLLIARILVDALEDMKLKYPKPDYDWRTVTIPD